MKSRGEMLESRAAALMAAFRKTVFFLAYRVADHRGAHQASNPSAFATLLIFRMNPN
jgi:hypothetical protein